MIKFSRRTLAGARKRAPGQQQGFTLIEMLMVMVIVGILMATVVPSYLDGLRKGRRADARAALTEMATKQEKFFSQNNAYATNVAAEGTGLGMGQTTSNGEYYNLTSAACAGGSISRCYLLTATATNGQEKDEDCVKLSLDSTGRKRSVDVKGQDSSVKCW